MKFTEKYKSFVKSGKDVSLDELKEIAKEKGVRDSDLDKFAGFMKDRFGNENLSSSYIDEWAGRWNNSQAIMYADSRTKKALLKAGYKGK